MLVKEAKVLQQKHCKPHKLWQASVENCQFIPDSCCFAAFGSNDTLLHFNTNRVVITVIGYIPESN